MSRTKEMFYAVTIITNESTEPEIMDEVTRAYSSYFEEEAKWLFNLLVNCNKDNPRLIRIQRSQWLEWHETIEEYSLEVK